MSKTLTLTPIKTSITVLFVFVLLFSCQKDALYTPSIKQQLIKKEEITALFNQMPVSNLLTPNWEQALQANMNGSAVVRMPIKNVDRLKDFVPAGLDLELKIPTNGKQMSLKTGSANSQTSTNGANPNYFEQHPPELFIVRDPVSNKLNASLLNFVPTNPTVDFGENGVWTGTLYEWNLKGEVVWAQEIVKNKLIDRYGLQNPVVENKNSTASSGKVLSLNDKKVSSFFAWLVDLIGDFIGWIAHTLGIPTYGGYPGGCSSCGSGWRIDWGTLGGAGDGGQGGFTGPVDRGDIYGSYIPGYAQGGGSYEPFPNTPGGPNPGSAVIPASTLYLISVLQLTDPVQMDFLATNSNISDELATYLDTNGQSTANIAFVTWAIGYLMLNTNTSFSEIESSLLNKPFDFEIAQNGYLPRDKEPSSYYWRTRLLSTNNLHEYLTIVALATPKSEIFNCHYHAFGLEYATEVDTDYPKLVSKMNITPGWQKVTGNIHVGDRISYHVPNSSGNGADWTHSAIVIEVDSDGFATKVSSKMGPFYQTIEHHPRDISPMYGINDATFTVNGQILPSRIYWRRK